MEVSTYNYSLPPSAPSVAPSSSAAAMDSPIPLPRISRLSSQTPPVVPPLPQACSFAPTPSVIADLPTLPIFPVSPLQINPLFSGLGLLYSVPQESLSESPEPTDLIDPASLSTGVVRFLSSTFKVTPQKKALVVTNLKFDASGENPDLFELELIFSFFLQEEFPVYFNLGDKLKKIENLYDIRENLPLIAFTDYETVSKMSQSEFSLDQVFFINSFNIQSLCRRMSPQCELPANPYSYCYPFRYIGNILGYNVETALEILRKSEDIEQWQTPFMEFRVFINASVDKLNKILELLKLLPKNSCLVYLEKNHTLIPDLITHFPIEKLSYLRYIFSPSQGYDLCRNTLSFLSNNPQYIRSFQDFISFLSTIQTHVPMHRTKGTEISSISTTPFFSHFSILLNNLILGKITPENYKKLLNSNTSTVLNLELPIIDINPEHFKDLKINKIHFKIKLEGLGNSEKISADKFAKDLFECINLFKHTLENLTLEFGSSKNKSSFYNNSNWFGLFIKSFNEKLFECKFPKLKNICFIDIVTKISDFLKFLKNCPGLEVLKLINVGVKAGGTDDADDFEDFTLPTHSLVFRNNLANKRSPDNNLDFFLALCKKMPDLQIIDASDLVIPETCLTSLPYLRGLSASLDPKLAAESFWKAFPSLRYFTSFRGLPDSFSPPFQSLVSFPPSPSDNNSDTDEPDIDSGEEKVTISTVNIFPEEPYSRTRLSISQISWKDGRINRSDAKLNFNLYTIPDLMIDETSKGFVEILVKKEQYTPLPGLSVKELLINPHAEGVKLEDLEFGFDEINRVYGVRLKASFIHPFVSIKLSFEVIPSDPYEPETPETETQKEQTDEIGITFTPETIETKNCTIKDSREGLDALIRYFNSFTEGIPEFTGKETIAQQLNLVLKYRKGAACILRSELFCLIAPKLFYGSTAQVILNDAHAYVQFTGFGDVLDIDLGGYPVDLQFIEPTPSTPAKTEEPSNKPEKGALSSHFKVQSYETYLHSLLKAIEALKSSHEKQALLLADKAHFHFLHQTLAAYAKSKKKPFASLLIQRCELAGMKVSEGKFLTTTTAQRDVLEKGGYLFVDLSRLDTLSISTFLQMTDCGKRKIGSIEISPKTVIIAVLPKSNPTSNDIGRRFQIIQEMPNLPPLQSSWGALVDSSQSPTPIEALEVDLYNDPTLFRQKLIGRLNGVMQWMEGSLIQAIKSNSPLVIYNLPLNQEATNLLLDLNYGKLYIDGKSIDLPDRFKIYLRKKSVNSQTLNFTRSHLTPDLLIHKSNFPNFLSQVKLDSGLIEIKSGLLASITETTFVKVLEPLSYDQWRQLLAIIENSEHKVIFIIPPTIPIPREIETQEIDTMAENEDRINTIDSSDPEFRLSKELKNQPNATVVPISSSSSFKNFMPRLERVSSEGIVFRLVKGELFEKLERGDTVIFVGNCSPIFKVELIAFAQGKKPGYHINGTFLPVSGQVMLITNSSAPSTGTDSTIDSEMLPSYPKPKVLSAIKILKDAGLPIRLNLLESVTRYLNAGIQNPLTYFNTDKKNPIRYSDRLDEVLNILDVSNIIYIYGPPASAKSYFILHVLPGSNRYKVFFEISRLTEFLESTEDAILCLEEGDLKPQVVEELMGIQTPEYPFYYQGKFYPLNRAKKRVVVTGNGPFCRRQKLPFIRNNGGAIYFPEIPFPVILNDILKPMLPDDQDAKTFASSIINFYQNARSNNKSVELRDLRSMGAAYHFFKHYLHQQSPEELAQIIFEEFCPGFLSGPTASKINAIHLELSNRLLTGQEKNTSYVLTESRKKVYLRIFMALWLRKENKMGLQKGMLIEGSPGEGKTDLVTLALKACQVEFIEIDINQSPNDVLTTLDECFHKGKVVVFHEFDGRFEGALNSYLTGYDTKGNKAEIDGFFILATANGNNYPYRLPLSQALRSRFIESPLPGYTASELEYILTTSGADPSDAKKWVQEYFERSERTRVAALKPTPLDLFNHFKDLKRQRPQRARRASDALKSVSCRKKVT